MHEMKPFHWHSYKYNFCSPQSVCYLIYSCVPSCYMQECVNGACTCTACDIGHSPASKMSASVQAFLACRQLCGHPQLSLRFHKIARTSKAPILWLITLNNTRINCIFVSEAFVPVDLLATRSIVLKAASGGWWPVQGAAGLGDWWMRSGV